MVRGLRWVTVTLLITIPWPTIWNGCVLGQLQCLHEAYHGLLRYLPSLRPRLYWIVRQVCMRDIPSCLPPSLGHLCACVWVGCAGYVHFIISWAYLLLMGVVFLSSIDFLAGDSTATCIQYVYCSAWSRTHWSWFCLSFLHFGCEVMWWLCSWSASLY